MATRSPRGRIVVCGMLFWYPLAGVTYQMLHYLVGLRRLGYDVYYVEDCRQWVYDPFRWELSPDASRNIGMVAPALAQYGFADRWAFRGSYPGGCSYGMDRAAVSRLYREADALLNVTGAQELREEHLACPRRIYIESDPFAAQIQVAQGDETTIAKLARHDVHFSFGENLGEPDCDIPVERFEWLPTRQPVVLDLWENAVDSSGVTYSTITTWGNNGKDVQYRGETYYWTKGREFQQFLDLPSRRPLQFEIAAAADERLESLLHEHGWGHADSMLISGNANRYRCYIQHSRGEFTVARDQYVRPRTGWFSDRSACYLAAGRPVITQETGFSKFLATGKGLYAFRTMEEIVAALDSIESDYEGNCCAAREIAAEYFAAEKVLGSLMERAGL